MEEFFNAITIRKCTKNDKNHLNYIVLGSIMKITTRDRDVLMKMIRKQSKVGRSVFKKCTTFNCIPSWHLYSSKVSCSSSKCNFAMGRKEQDLGSNNIGEPPGKTIFLPVIEITRHKYTCSRSNIQKYTR